MNSLLTESLVIDGTLNFARRVDPNCNRSNCKKEVADFSLIKARSGIDIGFVGAQSRVENLEKVCDFVQEEPDGILIKTYDDIKKVRQDKKFGVVTYCQMHYPLDGSIEPVSEWFDKGLRVLQIAYGKTDKANQSVKNRLGAGSDQKGWLTGLGRRIVRELNRVGIVVDVSHCNDDTTIQVADHSEKPILATHTNARRLTCIDRNKSNAALQKIAETGGVIGVCPIGWMIAECGKKKATIEDFIDHIDFIVQKVGIDHVGLSSDSYIDGWNPSHRHYSDADLNAEDRWSRVIDKLQERYSQRDLRKLLGLNFLRVLREVLPEK